MISTSDVHEKNGFVPLDDRATAFVLALEPIVYRWKTSGTQRIDTGETDWNGMPIYRREPKAGRRSHAGFSAQQVRAALQDAGLDLALWGLADSENPDPPLWLRLDLLLAQVVACMQHAPARINRSGGGAFLMTPDAFSAIDPRRAR